MYLIQMCAYVYVTLRTRDLDLGIALRYCHRRSDSRTHHLRDTFGIELLHVEDQCRVDPMRYITINNHLSRNTQGVKLSKGAL